MSEAKIEYYTERRNDEGSWTRLNKCDPKHIEIGGLLDRYYNPEHWRVVKETKEIVWPRAK